MLFDVAARPWPALRRGSTPSRQERPHVNEPALIVACKNGITLKTLRARLRRSES